MENNPPVHIRTISEYHKLCGLPKPEHPLISLINREEVKHTGSISLILDFYSISVKRDETAKFRYGQQEYDFDEGIMFFIAPNQVYGKIETGESSSMKKSGWMLLIHPDFFWNTPLSKKISQYEFFDYAVHEALFLSEKEENVIETIVCQIRQEYQSNIDKFSKNIVVSHIENLLSYAERFYHRQFITREKAHHQLLEKFEIFLNNYFNNDDLVVKGLPTVLLIAQTLNVSPKYLGNLVKILTGKNVHQHIHNKLINKAKEKLSTTDLTVSEISFQLGFEHLQSFSKLFKRKTNLSPLEFKRSFN
ncbi:AraC family transcriptional regulator [Mucilaginibacter limnophilus]|uniref:AraC family transcriptional regulator n=1 Tax=Mucilaginibacter limnophilus TaxID=1932778 RepID=A0A437MHX9_9SPHI|nr:helix-turn-helix domain-containing protein [Mucilaginibacter limnophilus]RVT97215.1 AraC family transcriptional regulator [Mucilaginibacter limnophilus]